MTVYQDLLPLSAGLGVSPIPSNLARQVAETEHYLHRKPPVSYAYGLHDGGELVGIVTFGIPASRQLQQSVCPTNPDLVLELNRLWVADRMPTNTESWFVSRALRMLPARIVVSYADTAYGHHGGVYRALTFRYAGWTDMDRKTPRFDYVSASGGHSRDAYRNGWTHRVPRKPKVKYWTTTGTRRDKQRLAALCGWSSLDWKQTPPPACNSLLAALEAVQTTKKTRTYRDITKVLLERLGASDSLPVKRRELAAEIGVSDDTISRAIKWAEKLGLLSWTPPQIPGGLWCVTPPQKHASTPPQIASEQVNPLADSIPEPEEAQSTPSADFNDWDQLQTFIHQNTRHGGLLWLTPPEHHRRDHCADDCWDMWRWNTITKHSYTKAV
ncbi:hypothetical protein ACFWHF_14530 [Streptomyces griseoincarnatus]